MLSYHFVLSNMELIRSEHFRKPFYSHHKNYFLISLFLLVSLFTVPIALPYKYFPLPLSYSSDQERPATTAENQWNDRAEAASCPVSVTQPSIFLHHFMIIILSRFALKLYHLNIIHHNSSTTGYLPSRGLYAV